MPIVWTSLLQKMSGEAVFPCVLSDRVQLDLAFLENISLIGLMAKDSSKLLTTR